MPTARGNAAQQRPSAHQPQKQWQRGLLPSAQHAADHAILQEDLQALRKTGRQLPPPLHCAKVIGDDSPSPERGGQDVGRGDSILDGEIDPDTAYRRHRVGGITDAQQPGPIPPPQAIDANGQKLDLAPIAEFTDAVARKGD